MSARIWFTDDGCGGLRCYIGGDTGLEFNRHGYDCKPGMWSVRVTGWAGMNADAIVDDFGNLVQVHS